MALFLADKIAWDQAGAPPYLETVERELSRSLYHASLALHPVRARPWHDPVAPPLARRGPGVVARLLQRRIGPIPRILAVMVREPHGEPECRAAGAFPRSVYCQLLI
jgi:hypothetical protein